MSTTQYGTPTANRHPLSISTLPSSSPSPPSHPVHSHLTPRRLHADTPRAAMRANRPRLTPIITSFERPSSALGFYEDVILDRDPTRAASEAPSPPKRKANHYTYISPSNPISRTALPSFSPRAYSALLAVTSNGGGYINAKCSSSFGQDGKDRYGSGAEVLCSPRSRSARDEGRLRMRTTPGLSPAAVLQVDEPTFFDEKHGDARDILVRFDNKRDDKRQQMTYTLGTCPLDLPIDLASPATPARRVSSQAGFGAKVMEDKRAFANRLMSLLVYVILGMFISMLIISPVPRSRPGAVVNIDLDSESANAPSISTSAFNARYERTLRHLAKIIDAQLTAPDANIDIAVIPDSDARQGLVQVSKGISGYSDPYDWVLSYANGRDADIAYKSWSEGPGSRGLRDLKLD